MDKLKMLVYNKIVVQGGIMKNKLLGIVLALCLIVPAICILSACETLYDIEITTSTPIEHIQEIKFSSSNSKKATYRTEEDTYIEVICDQGYAPDLTFEVGNLQINKYGDYFGEIYDYSAVPETVSGVRYVYTVPTVNLTGKQTVTYRGGTKDAKVRLNFALDKGGDDVDPFDGDYTGLSFVITDHNDNQIQQFTAEAFINFANENKYVFVDYNEEVTITLKSTREMNNGSAALVFSDVYSKFVRTDAPEYDQPQTYCSWTYKSDVNFELLLNVIYLKQVFPQE